MRKPLIALGLALLINACVPPDPVDAGRPDAAAPDAGAPDAGGFDGGVPDAAGLDAGADAGTDAGPLCDVHEVPLHLVNYGDTDRYFIEVTLDGAQVALQLDTGSSLNFLYQPANTPPYVPDFAEVTMGCETVSVAARNIPASGQVVDGLDVVGTLGMELLLRRASLLDVEGARLLRYADWPEDVASLAEFSVAFDNVIDHALVPVTLDGEDVRLMFDTGGGHTLWVGQDGQPGDVEELVQDAEGNVFSIYTGTGTLGLPGEADRVIPLARAPAFPYFDQTVDALGGNLHGLMGVTAFLGEALLFDGDADRFWVIDKGQLTP